MQQSPEIGRCRFRSGLNSYGWYDESEDFHWAWLMLNEQFEQNSLVDVENDYCLIISFDSLMMLFGHEIVSMRLISKNKILWSAPNILFFWETLFILIVEIWFCNLWELVRLRDLSSKSTSLVYYVDSSFQLKRHSWKNKHLVTQYLEN